MIKLEYCRSEDHIAYILTKQLNIDAFMLRDRLGMKVVQIIIKEGCWLLIQILLVLN